MTSSRLVALRVLNRYRPQNTNLSELLGSELNRISGITDYGFIRGLVWGVVRYLRTLDWIISRYSDRKKIDIETRNILRLGLFQLFYSNGEVPEYAALNESVELAKRANKLSGAGFVNAVLRKAQENLNNILSFDKNHDNAEIIGLKFSYPSWMAERWVHRLGTEATAAFCKAGNEAVPLTIRINSSKISRELLKNKLEKEGEQVEYCQFSPDGLKFKSKPRLEKLESFNSGLFCVQDEASQVVSYMLSAGPGEDILDLCSGSGIKSSHLAQIAGAKATITAVDNSGERLRKARENFVRFGTKNVKLVKADAARLKNIKAAKVLLDAPCSGLGAIRRKPDIKWNRTEEDITARFPDMQKRLLSAAAEYVAPGGTLVYCTCTTEPEENEMIIEEFLGINRDFKLESPELPRSAAALISGSYYRTLWHVHGTDCFFGAKLVRRLNSLSI